MKLILDQSEFRQPLGKIVCVGRNYAAHAKELNNPIPSSPILFIKPASSGVNVESSISIPKDQGSVHHELEIAILIGESLSSCSEKEAQAAIAGVGLGLDLTLRDVQDSLKEKGHPWERAKSFDGACPLSEFVSIDLGPACQNLQHLELTLEKNGQTQQQGSSSDMLFPILGLIMHMSEHFSLKAGDVILTGTPAGVGPLLEGDTLAYQLSLNDSVLVKGGTEVK